MKVYLGGLSLKLAINTLDGQQDGQAPLSHRLDELVKVSLGGLSWKLAINTLDGRLYTE